MTDDTTAISPETPEKKNQWKAWLLILLLLGIFIYLTVSSFTTHTTTKVHHTPTTTTTTAPAKTKPPTTSTTTTTTLPSAVVSPKAICFPDVPTTYSGHYLGVECRADVARSTVVANPKTINVSEVSVITVTLRDKNGAPLPNKLVRLTRSNRELRITAEQPFTNAKGQAFFTVGDNKPGATTFVARDETDHEVLKPRVTVRVVAKPSGPITTPTTLPTGTTPPVTASSEIVTAVVANPTRTEATTSQNSEVLVTVTKNGSPLANQTVALSSSSTTATFNAVQPVTDGSGVAEFRISDPVSETVTVTARDASDPTASTSTVQINFYACAYALSSDSTSVMIANNCGGNYGTGSVTEENIATSVQTEINSPSFDNPTAISDDSTDTWVTNNPGFGPGSVSEINNATGAVTVYDSPLFTGPISISSDGVDVWVLNASTITGAAGSETLVDGTVDEIDIATGVITQVSSSDFTNPSGISSDGTDVFVSNLHDSVEDSPGVFTDYEASVVEIDIATGAVTQIENVLLTNPAAITSDNSDVWVAQGGSSFLLRINASTDAITATDIAADGSNIVSNGTDAFTGETEFSTANGATQALATSENSIATNGTYLWYVTSAATVARISVPPLATANYVSQSVSTVAALDTAALGIPFATGSTVPADGSSSITVTVTARDGFGDPVSGQTISLASRFSGTAIITPASATTNAQGVATFTVTDTQAEVVQLEATDTTNGTELGEATATFVAPGQSETYTDPAGEAPEGITLQDGDAWVAEETGVSATGSVTEIDEDTQAETQIALPSSLFPAAITSDANNVFVANSEGGTNGTGSVSEINIATGDVTQINDLSFSEPDAITDDGSDVWVANGAYGITDSGSVTEINAATGAVVAEFTSPLLYDPTDISSDGVDVWITSQANNSLTEINIATGVVTAVGGIPLDLPSGVASNGTDVFVSSGGGSGSVYELDIATGLTTQISDSDLDSPGSIALSGPNAFVTDGGVGVSQINISPTAVTVASANPATFVTTDGVSLWTIEGSEVQEVPVPPSQVGVVSIDRSTVTTNNLTVPDDGTSTATITVTLNDGDGAPVVGKAVTLTASGGSSVITAVNATTNAEGQAVFTVTDTSAETVTYTATDTTDSSEVITQTASVEFLPSGGSYTTIALPGIPGIPDQLVVEGGNAYIVVDSDLLYVVNQTTGGTRTITDPSFDGGISGITGDANDIWVLNGEGSVSEISVATGVVTVISDPSFDEPSAITDNGTDVFVTNQAGGSNGTGSISEINVATSAVSVIDDSFPDTPLGVAANDSDIFVTNFFGGNNGTGFVDEINIATGVMTEIDDVSFDAPVAVDVSGPDVWVGNEQGGTDGNGSVSEIDIATGVVTQINDPSINSPVAIVATGSTVYVANQGGGSLGVGSVSEINTSTNAVTTDSTLANGVASIQAMAIGADGNLWVSNNGELCVGGTGGSACIGGTQVQTQNVVTTANVPVPPTVSASLSTITTSSATEPDNGSSAATVTVTMLYSNGLPVVGDTVSVHAVMNYPGQQITPIDDVTNAEGQATFSVTSPSAATISYTAEDTTASVIITATTSVTYGPTGPASASLSTVSAQGGDTNPGDGVTPTYIDVQIVDENGDAIAGDDLELIAESGSSTITGPSPATTNFTGQTSFTVYDSNAETVTYQVVDETSGVTLAETVTITFQ